jgi:SAM-dependent methyltransferase
MTCKVCHHEMSRPNLEATEMMFGLKTRHEYYECSNCGALQIGEVPANLGDYYPANYYSFNQKPDPAIDTTFLRKLKSGYLIYHTNKIPGALLSIGYKVPEHIAWLKTTGVQYDDAILDVGSGSGDLLMKLCKAGFTNLTGTDPFLPADFVSANGKLKLLKRSVFEDQGQPAFDLVMLNHSFEHMDAPAKVFRRLGELVRPGKFLLVRTPVNRSFASVKYKADWVDMDPPRHLVVHSVKSMQLLAQANGFVMERIVFDSTAFQFWGSEQYIRGITLHDPRSLAVDKKSTIFSEDQKAAWKRQAGELNEKGEGDQACFYMRKK